MDEDNVVNLRRPDDRTEDRLTEVLRHGPRTLLAQAIEAEVADFLASHAGLVDGGGRPSSPLCSNERLATALDMMLPAGGARGPGCVPVGDRYHPPAEGPARATWARDKGGTRRFARPL